jgi:LuxR family maltose regulon positive regulatory protein
LIAGARGRCELQSLLADQAARLARERGLEEIEGDVFIALGAALETRGELDEALKQFERAVVIFRAAGHPRTLAHALIRQAGSLHAANRRESAAEVIDEARATVALCPDPGILADWLAALEPAPRTRLRNREGPLSERELVILRMLTSRLSERDIGRELYLSHNTIHSHTRSIYRKLGVSSRRDALENARERGLI